MADPRTLDLNRGAALRAQDGVRGSERLAAMREAFESLPDVSGLFGAVPGGDAAEQALRSAASAMLSALTNTGLTVQDIDDSAGRMAEIVDETDQAAHARLVAAGEATGALSDVVGGPLATTGEPE